MTRTLPQMFAVGLVLSALAVRVYAADGVVLVQQMTGTMGTTSSHAQVTKSKIRSEITNGQGQRQILVFDADRQVLDIINPDAKTYSELTKADVEAVGQQMQGLIAQMQSMPPAARAQMEARGMGAIMGTQPKPEYRKNGTETVGRWTCDKYDGTRGGQPAGYVCTVPGATLGLTAADLEVTRQLAAFMADMIPQLAGQLGTIGSIQGIDGVPVKSVNMAMGQTVTMVLTDVKRQAIDDAQFTIPAGFTKQDMVGMMGAGGGGRGRGRGAQ